MSTSQLGVLLKFKNADTIPQHLRYTLRISQQYFLPLLKPLCRSHIRSRGHSHVRSYESLTNPVFYRCQQAIWFPTISSLQTHLPPHLLCHNSVEHPSYNSMSSFSTLRSPDGQKRGNRVPATYSTAFMTTSDPSLLISRNSHPKLRLWEHPLTTFLAGPHHNLADTPKTAQT
jgi:hypothetical protein